MLRCPPDGGMPRIDIPRRLGAQGAEELFGGLDAEMHATSAIRYPTFVDGKNYTGHGPAMTEHPLLVSMLDELLCPAQSGRWVSSSSVGRAAGLVVGRSSVDGARAQSSRMRRAERDGAR